MDSLREIFSNPRKHAILIAAVLAAIVARVVFWAYTGRIWEDSLIALTPARNLWEGFGLTHHVSEPKASCFSSPLGELVLIIGESVRQGLATIRLVSIASSVAAIFFAYRICDHFNIGAPGKALICGFLALDHLQIFFGMSGMETQLATALLFGCIYFLLKERWWTLGVMGGLALLCRPEFALLVGTLGLSILIMYTKQAWKVAAAGAAITVPWYTFATIYFGSPIPQTVIAKQALTQGGFMKAGLGAVVTYIQESWRYLAPFKQYWAAYEAPVPDPILFAIVMLVVALAILGAVSLMRADKKTIVPLATLLLFFAYKFSFTLPPYFMWYMPPFVALLMLFAAAGLGASARFLPTKATGVVSAILVFAYGMHLPFTLPLDRTVQEEIEYGVRARLGATLDKLMTDRDAAIIEPLGYPGWYARNKTLYDFPGLGSPIALAALQRHPGGGIPTVFKDLQPSFIVLRPGEKADVEKWVPEIASEYETVAHIVAERPISLNRWGLSYWVTDTDFTIWKRKR